MPSNELTDPALELFDMILDICTHLSVSKLCAIYQTRICFCFLLGSLAVQLTFYISTGTNLRMIELYQQAWTSNI